MIDALQLFDGSVSAAGVFTGAAITTSRASTNVLDMYAQRDIMGTAVHVIATQAFVGGTSVQIAYQTSPDNATFVDVMLSPVLLTANLIVGQPFFRYAVPPMSLNDTGQPNRYHRLNYTVVGTYTGGAVGAYVTAYGDRQVFNAYASGYSIDA